MKLGQFLRGLRAVKRRAVDGDEYAGFRLAETLTTVLAPSYVFSEWGRTWLDDTEFWAYYDELVGENRHSADRKFMLRSLLALVEGVPGDLAECGTYEGASAHLLAQRLDDEHEFLHLFESFQGLPRPSVADGDYWKGGDLAANEELVRTRLARFGEAVVIHAGWIPDRFPEVEDRVFSFVHVDVDLYEPTAASVRFFYPRLVTGAVLLFDDYGFSSCPGARRAIDEFVGTIPEPLVHIPTGQAFLVKR